LINRHRFCFWKVPVSQLIIAHKARDGVGVVEFVATICRDITERTQAEAALQEREETFRRLFEGAHSIRCC
jgi:PAS domain-containing protein